MRAQKSLSELAPMIAALLALLAAMVYVAGCGGGGGGSRPASFTSSGSSSGVAVTATLKGFDNVGQAAIDVRLARTLLLRIHEGTAPSSPVAAQFRLDLTQASQALDATLPGLQAGSYLIVGRVLATNDVVLAETGCVFPLVPGPASTVKVDIDPNGIALADPTGRCPGGNPLPQLLSGLNLSITRIAGPATATRGQSGLAYEVDVRNTGNVLATITSAFLAFSGAGLTSVLNSPLPLSVAPGGSTTLSFSATVSGSSTGGTSSIRATVLATGPSNATTSISQSAPFSLVVSKTGVAKAPVSGAAFGDRIAFTDPENGRVLVYDVSWPQVPAAVVEGLSAPSALAFAGHRLLVSDAGAGSVLVYDDARRLPAEGAVPVAELRHEELRVPGELRVDGETVRVTDSATGRVYELAMP